MFCGFTCSSFSFKARVFLKSLFFQKLESLESEYEKLKTEITSKKGVAEDGENEVTSLKKVAQQAAKEVFSVYI